jgi:phosphoribosyl-dephospho-CoA transferase
MRVCAAPPFAVAEQAALSCDARWRPHDLLRLRALQAFDDEPAWVRDAFERAPYAVVRRALAADGVVAIGVRGVERAQRYGAWAQAEDVVTVVSPEALIKARPLAGRATLPPFVALARLAGQHSDANSPLSQFVWGPTGSAGFELATQMPAVTGSSDLDLLIRTPEPLSQAIAGELLEQLQTLAEQTGIRVDAQLETPAGGVALVEWAARKARVMARHARGPHLIADPWAIAEGVGI